MDTSEQYINMCRKATELQEMWIPGNGDWFYYDTLNIVTCIGEFVKAEDVYNATGHGGWKIGKNNSVWLPRIDQLIDMFGNDLRPDEGFTMTIKNRKTTEQELLNEHYKNTYHRSWNGEDWI